MATWKPDSLITKGALASFHERLADIPQVWQNHCALYDSTTAVENYVFPGFIPKPRLFLDQRNIAGVGDFTFNITNNEYELSLAIGRKHFEDDQTGLIAARMREIAEVWGTYKDFLFSEMLVNGASSGSNGWDGNTFYNDSRTIGDSATIDNKTTETAATDTIPTVAELILQLNVIKALMRRFQDDTGRPFNTLAVNKLRMVVPPSHESVMMELLNSTVIMGEDSSNGPGGSRTNVWKNLVDFDILDYLSSDAKVYVNALGAERKPFIFQERTPLEVIIMDDEKSVALHNAVLVLCRQRFVFAYGEPRRSVEHTWS